MLNLRESTTFLSGRPGLVGFQMYHLTSSGRNEMRCRNLLLRKYISMRYTRTIQVECFHQEVCCGFSTMRSRKRMERIPRTVVAGVSCSEKTIPGYNELQRLISCLLRASLKAVLSALPARLLYRRAHNLIFLILIGQTMKCRNTRRCSRRFPLQRIMALYITSCWGIRKLFRMICAWSVSLLRMV